MWCFACSAVRKIDYKWCPNCRRWTMHCLTCGHCMERSATA